MFLHYFRIDEQLNLQLKLFIKTVVGNFWSLPPTSTSLVKYSIDFVKTVSVYRFCVDEKLAKEMENSLLKITGIILFSIK